VPGLESHETRVASGEAALDRQTINLEAHKEKVEEREEKLPALEKKLVDQVTVVRRRDKELSKLKQDLKRREVALS
jgi:hypothetical protein